MAKKFIVLVLAVTMFCSAAHASGFRPPAHSQLTYSFTCPSGASGHISYTKDFVTDPTSAFSIWVNGQYIQDDPKLSKELHGKNIEQVLATCEGDNTAIFLMTFQPGASEDFPSRSVMIQIDLFGNVGSVGSLRAIYRTDRAEPDADGG
jgi:hypothetical protein